jgi:hypothetical protein
MRLQLRRRGYVFPTDDQMADPLSAISSRYRLLARDALAMRNVHPRIVDKIVPKCTDAITALTIIAIAKNNSTH